MKLKFLSMLALASGTMISLSSCSNDDVLPGGGETDDTKPGTGDTRRYMNLVVGVDVESSSGATYSAAYTDLSSTDLSISFKGWGFEVPSVRTARVYASEAGDYLYNLSYGGGTISKYQVNGGQN